MKTRLRLRLGFLGPVLPLSAFLVGAALAACGARTGLPVNDVAHPDAGPDVVEEDAPDVMDAADVIDAPVDIDPTSCVDAGITYIYVVTEQNELLHFDPSNRTFTSNGSLDCSEATSPFSMAVQRSGIALVLFQDGRLFRVDPATMSCNDTGFAWTVNGTGQTFGMGYSADVGDPQETLFVATDPTPMGDAAPPPSELATIDTTAFTHAPVGTLSSAIGAAELTGTGDGKLYAFGVDLTTFATHLAQLDKTNATVLSDVPLPLSGTINDWAFAFWGGKFYFFTAPAGGSSTVSEYDPVTGKFDPSYATLDQAIVGAGVSTCAPL